MTPDNQLNSFAMLTRTMHPDPNCDRISKLARQRLFA